MENKTPRSGFRCEVREKRLAYFQNQDHPTNSKSGNSSQRKFPTSVSTAEKNNHSRSDRTDMNGDIRKEVNINGNSVDCLNLDTVQDEIPTARTLDTSRTSDILMETARDFREVLKDRETLRSKRSSKTAINNGNELSCTSKDDLTNRSVTEVLKVLEERASYRRRELPRLSDFSESDEDLLDPEPTSAMIEEENVNFKKKSKEWEAKLLSMCSTEKAFDSQHPTNAMKNDNFRSEKFVEDYSGINFINRLDQTLIDHTYDEDPELVKNERQLEQQQQSILRKILGSSEFEEKTDRKTAEHKTPICLDPHVNLPKFTPTQPTRAKIAFSVDDIISEAKQFSLKDFNHSSLPHQMENSNTGTASSHNERQSNSPLRRSVHFNCPPSPSDCEPSKKDGFRSDVGSSVETKSTPSTSIVSLMSIQDVADRLEQLGINPHLLGIGLTTGQNKHGDDKLKRKNKTRRLVKICPECGKYNAETVSWCLACSCVLIGIEPQLPKRRNKNNRKRNSSSYSSSFDSSKESMKSSMDLNSSNGSSVLGHSYDEREEGPSDFRESKASFNGGHCDNQATCGDYNRQSNDNSASMNGKSNGVPWNNGQHVVKRSNEDDIPSSIYDDAVDDLVSPLTTTEREKVGTPSAVWNPNQINVAELLHQSRALLDYQDTPHEEKNRVSLEQPQHSYNTPRHLQSSAAARNVGPTLMSVDSTSSSISLATPSPNRSKIPANVKEDLKLDLAFSSLEDSPNSPVKKGAVDIAVLDHQEILAMRENSSASAKPDSVPDLPLMLSPSSSVYDDIYKTNRFDDLEVEDMYPQDPVVEVDAVDRFAILSEPPQFHGKVSEKQKSRYDFKRRPASGTSSNNLRSSNSRNESDVRRPMSSSQQPENRRRWKNSSQAWSNHHPSQLKKKPAEYIVKQSLNVSKSKDKYKTGNVSYMKNNGEVVKQRNNNSRDSIRKDTANGGHRDPNDYEYEKNGEKPISDRNLLPQDAIDREYSEKRLLNLPPAEHGDSKTQPMGLNDNSLSYLQERGWQSQEESPWLYLADEVWLRIFKFLSPKDLSSSSATCKRLHRIANDSSLWRCPVVKRKRAITEDELLTIGSRRPVSLKLRQCQGMNISLQALKTFFGLCAGSLRKLCFSGCNHGAFSEDQFILLAAMFCPQLTSVDISFAHGVRDSTVRALAEECERLEVIRLNGGQNVTDASVKTLVETHGDSLRKLELYCCFGVTSESVRLLGKRCDKLTHASFGSCNRISSSALVHFASHRREHLKCLDLRGMHSVLDSTITAIVAVCPNLESLALSNCGSVSNLSIRAIANHCPRLRKLDVCGCNQVGSDSAQELVRKCKNLEELDFSSTCVDHKTVTCLAHTWTPKLKCLRLNFCCNLKEDGIFKLCANSKSLSSLYLYGIRNFGVSVFERIRKEYPRIEVKSDDALETTDS